MRSTPNCWLVLCVLLAACERGAPHSQASAASVKRPLTIGYSALRISLPLFVAERQGLFKANGLDVRLNRYDTAQPLVDAVLDGQLDAGGYAALPIVFTAAARDGAHFGVVSALIEDADHPISYLLKKRGDESLRQVSDLRGKRVGVLPTLAYQRWLPAIAQHAGLAPGDLHVVPLAPPQQVTGLAEGVVDALFTNDPMATSALASGVAERFGPQAPLVDATAEPVWFGSFLVNAAFARTHADELARLVKALDQAIDSVMRDQAAAKALAKSYMRDSEQPYVDRYPPAHYRKSTALSAELLQAELAREVRFGILDKLPPREQWQQIAAEGP